MLGHRQCVNDDFLEREVLERSRRNSFFYQSYPLTFSVVQSNPINMSFVSSSASFFFPLTAKSSYESRTSRKQCLKISAYSGKSCSCNSELFKIMLGG